MNKPIDSLELEQQIETLRQQLHEAEDLRRAISHGEVDAFVVGPTEDSKRVLMLSGAYSRYRQLVEDMQQGAVTVARSGEIMFANNYVLLHARTEFEDSERHTRDLLRLWLNSEPLRPVIPQLHLFAKIYKDLFALQRRDH